MAKVLEHTPAWLSRPSPGFQVFQPTHPPKPSTLTNGQGRKLDHYAPSRTVAHKGTQVFIAIGSELKWADLVALKDARQGEQNSRLLKTSVAGHIRQLAISPLGDYLAIATSHTVHVAILPARFDTSAPDPLRLRTFQLGPTAHVLEQAPVVSLLWHPFASLGSSLVTVTSDACVRLWELNPDSRHSFDEPALALDLKKLANATSTTEDLRASVYGTSKAFSPDSVEMEVAAAAFGGVGSDHEHPWAPMTLWLAMTEGDVYALCPFLPSKWQPAKSTLSSLTTAMLSRAAALETAVDASDTDKRNASRQHDWLSDINAQDSSIAAVPGSYESVEVYNRPLSLAAIPRLQGPFRLTPEPEHDITISDIHIIAPKADDLSEDADPQTDLSVGLVCLLSTSGKVYVCLDVDGVEASWLPTKQSHFQRPPINSSMDLMLLETIDISLGQHVSSWPSFTPLVNNRYAAEKPLYLAHQAGRYGFFVTALSGVFSCNLTPWLTDLEDELSGPDESGSTFRAGLLYDSQKTQVDKVIRFHASSKDIPSTCISVIDSDLSHLVLSVHNHQPCVASLELALPRPSDDMYAPDATQLPLSGLEAREVYQPHSSFFAATSLPAFVNTLTQSGATRLKRADLKNDIRLSPATLQLLTEAHRVLSTETNKLGLAAADLFRRCQRMQAELAEQITKVSELAARADSVLGVDNSITDGCARKKLDTRMICARDKSTHLKQRVDTLRKRIGGLGGKEPSKREEAWAVEVDALNKSLSFEKGPTTERFQAIQKLARDVIDRAREAAKTGDDTTKADEADDTASRRSSMLGNEFRKQRLQHVMALLERETALVDAVTERLERLGGLAG